MRPRGRRWTGWNRGLPCRRHVCNVDLHAYSQCSVVGLVSARLLGTCVRVHSVMVVNATPPVTPRRATTRGARKRLLESSPTQSVVGGRALSAGHGAASLSGRSKASSAARARHPSLQQMLAKSVLQAPGSRKHRRGSTGDVDAPSSASKARFVRGAHCRCGLCDTIGKDPCVCVYVCV